MHLEGDLLVAMNGPAQAIYIYVFTEIMYI